MYLSPVPCCPEPDVFPLPSFLRWKENVLNVMYPLHKGTEQESDIVRTGSRLVGAESVKKGTTGHVGRGEHAKSVKSGAWNDFILFGCIN